MYYAVMLTPGATLRQQQPSKRPLHLRQRCRRRISINLPCRAIACQRGGRSVKSVHVVVRATRVCTHVRCKVPALRLSCHRAATFVVRSQEVQAARETLWRTACASIGRYPGTQWLVKTPADILLCGVMWVSVGEACAGRWNLPWKARICHVRLRCLTSRHEINAVQSCDLSPTTSH